MLENQSQYEEISLVELIVMWLKHWKPAVISGLVVMALAAFLVSVLTPKYESKVSLQIGSLGEDLLQSPSVLVARLKALHRVGDDTQGMRPLPRLQAISNNKREDSPVIELTARAYTAESAAEFLSQLTREIVDDHNMDYQKSRKEKQALYEQLLLQKGDSGEVLAKIQTELAVMHPSKLLSAPSVPVKPAAPKKLLLYTMALILGFFVTLILPFVLAFIASIKQELKRQAD